MGEIRLQKLLAEAGIASRRKAEEIIKQGRVSVNGLKVSCMGIKVEESDTVEVDGKKVERAGKKIYIMLNKPEGYVSTVKDQFGRKTVMDLITGVEERIFPVGRLDYDTSGLLLLTNDGELAYRTTHPKHEIEKVYVAEVKGYVTREDVKRFEEGLEIDGYKTAPARMRVMEAGKNFSLVEIKIHEGRNRQVRKMCDIIGHTVVKLKRVAEGHLRLGNLKEGEWRHLSRKELELLTGRK